MKPTKEMVEAAALQLATMEGKRERFLADKAGSLGDEDGTYEGYSEEARMILAAGLSAVSADPVAWMTTDKDGFRFYFDMRPAYSAEDINDFELIVDPLFTSPPDLAAENARLREALEPFGLISSEGVVKAETGHVTVTTCAEYFHRARAALADQKGGAV